MSDRHFALPVRRNRWWSWSAAMVVHLVLLVVLLNHYRKIPRWIAPDPRVVRGDAMPEVALAAPRVLHHAPVARAPLTRPVPATLPANDVPAPSGTSVATLVAPATVDSPPTAAALHPQYGSGRLWVHPLAESPRRIASVLTGKSPSQLSDSVITSMVQAYLNEMADEDQGRPAPLPSWTTKIGGKTVGVDQKWIYLGPIKVPTALLAFLPLKVQANPTQAEFNAKLMQMRSDLMEAARRSENYDEFKHAVQELNEQVKEERQFKKNQRTPPDSGKPS